jgi:hypothetical protein
MNDVAIIGAGQSNFVRFFRDRSGNWPLKDFQMRSIMPALRLRISMHRWSAQPRNTTCNDHRPECLPSI